MTTLAAPTLRRGSVSLAERSPQLVAEWHPTLNGILTPDNTTQGSSRKVWWRCAAGHDYEARISNRTQNGTGCSRCSGFGRSGQVGIRTLAEHSPHLVAEWHPSLNGLLTPDDTTQSSARKVWWRCAAGHEYQARVANRSRGSGCTRCAHPGRPAQVGTVSLAANNPELALGWHPTLNEPLTPADVSYGSYRKVWWLCGRGHTWEATVASRTSARSGCPFCRRLKYGTLAERNPGLAAWWHPTLNGDLTANDVSSKSNRLAFWLCGNGHTWQAAVHRVPAQGCRACVESGLCPNPALSCRGPIGAGLVAQWHPERNDDLLPDHVTASSELKVWWLCSAGHEWEATVHNRSKGRGCPRCYRLGEGSLAVLNPELAAFWDAASNGGLTPADVSHRSNRKVTWSCPFCGVSRVTDTGSLTRGQVSCRCQPAAAAAA